MQVMNRDDVLLHRMSAGCLWIVLLCAVAVGVDGVGVGAITSVAGNESSSEEDRSILYAMRRQHEVEVVNSIGVEGGANKGKDGWRCLRSCP